MSFPRCLLRFEGWERGGGGESSLIMKFSSSEALKHQRTGKSLAYSRKLIKSRQFPDLQPIKTLLDDLEVSTLACLKRADMVDEIFEVRKNNLRCKISVQPTQIANSELVNNNVFSWRIGQRTHNGDTPLSYFC